jgi:hypothetical protein
LGQFVVQWESKYQFCLRTRSCKKSRFGAVQIYYTTKVKKMHHVFFHRGADFLSHEVLFNQFLLSVPLYLLPAATLRRFRPPAWAWGTQQVEATRQAAQTVWAWTTAFVIPQEGPNLPAQLRALAWTPRMFRPRRKRRPRWKAAHWFAAAWSNRPERLLRNSSSFTAIRLNDARGFRAVTLLQYGVCHRGQPRAERLMWR